VLEATLLPLLPLPEPVGPQIGPDSGGQWLVVVGVRGDGPKIIVRIENHKTSEGKFVRFL